MARRLAVLITMSAAVGGLAACGSPTVRAEDVAAAAEDAFEQESGGIRFPVICPDDVEAEVGAQTYCVLRNTTRNEDFDVRVTVTSVEDDTAQFDFEFGTQPVG
ncbi:hypothetical protein GCM10010531_33690 [Blastococcus jejuensis]|uniref:DUF4333 domain-containing protein n=1 Tax=Blastococcus jejuensis TaxID=351224 RepID=A0ABP6PI01_9ACTN